ncbi:MAG: hypothetical protein FJ304_04465 [Planctomycetes bacterium]|nr:hypothetical protein [Planctomycetota bacterium]
MLPTSLADRRAKLLALLIERGPLSITELQAALDGEQRHAVERALSCSWFERITSGRGARYAVTELGRAEVKRAN